MVWFITGSRWSMVWLHGTKGKLVWDDILFVKSGGFMMDRKVVSKDEGGGGGGAQSSGMELEAPACANVMKILSSKGSVSYERVEGR